MKKLNRKGFTLVELLAIIVILAVILVVAVPPLLETMDNTKKKSLVNSAKTAASGWSTNISAAQLEPPAQNSVEEELYISWGSSWKCLSTSHMTALGIDSTQYVSGSSTGTLDTSNPTCSMAKVENGSVSVVLVVGPSHQMYVADFASATGNKYMWAGNDPSIHSWS